MRKAGGIIWWNIHMKIFNNMIYYISNDELPIFFSVKEKKKKKW